MKNLARVITTIALLTAADAARAAAPVVTSVYPASQRINAGRNTVIEAHFDQDVDDASVTPITFRIYGRWSGVHTYTRVVTGKTISATLDEPFFPGEWVTVSMSKGISNQSAEGLNKGYSWNFWTAAAKGSNSLVYNDRVNVRVSPETWVQVYGAYAGDLNKDGWSDFTAPCEQTNDARVFLSNNGVFANPPTKVTMPNGAIPSPNEGADFDNDGNIDLVIGNTGGLYASILFGNGLGGFPSGRKTSILCGNTVRGVGVGDFNGDGWDDFVTANRFAGSTGGLSIVLNNGDGTFATAVTKETGKSGEYTIAIADANNDGIPDIFCGCFASPYWMVLLLGDGDGAFNVSTSIAEGGSPWQTVVGDFNGDGNVDVASCNSNTNNMGIMTGNGNGGLSAVTLIATNSFPLAIDAGDIDGDGDLELVTSCYTAAKWNIFPNAAGVFSAATKITLNASSAGSCAVLHDRDNDGDLDLSGLDEIDDWIYFYDNPGTTSTSVPPPVPMMALLQNHPNPFNPSTLIRFELKQNSNATLSVYDATGAFVTTLAAGPYAKGSHDVVWNGTDARGGRVGSGVYFYRLTAAGTTLTRKMVLLK